MSDLAAIKNVQDNGTPQQKRIIEHFLRHGSLSQYESLMLYHIAALPRRIADLKDAGVEITTQRRKDPVGRIYARYRLRNPPSSVIENPIQDTNPILSVA